MNVKIMLTRLTARQRNFYIHAYPNYQALFRVLAVVRSIGPQKFGNRRSDLNFSRTDGWTT